MLIVEIVSNKLPLGPSALSLWQQEHLMVRLQHPPYLVP